METLRHTRSQGTLQLSERGRVDHCIILRCSFEIVKDDQGKESKHEDLLAHRNKKTSTILGTPPLITPYLRPAAGQTRQINVETLAFYHRRYRVTRPPRRLRRLPDSLPAAMDHRVVAQPYGLANPQTCQDSGTTCGEMQGFCGLNVGAREGHRCRRSG